MGGGTIAMGGKSSDGDFTNWTPTAREPMPERNDFRPPRTPEDHHDVAVNVAPQDEGVWQDSHHAIMPTDPAESVPPPGQKSFIGWTIPLLLAPPVYPLVIPALVWSRSSQSYTAMGDFPRAWLYYRRAQRTCLAAYLCLLLLLLAIFGVCVVLLKKEHVPPTVESRLVDTLGLLSDPLSLDEPDLTRPPPTTTPGTFTDIS